MTSTRAGITPANRREKPSSLMMDRSVPNVEGDLAGFEPGRTCSSDSDLRAVIRVFTTQIGFVMRTVALPARAPAIIDSIVVSFFEARPDFSAAFSKKALVHSYPSLWSVLGYFLLFEQPTIVVYEVCGTDAEEG